MDASRNELNALRGRLEEYLRQKGLPTRKSFHCLNPEHPDRHPSMSFHRKTHTVHCFSCGATYDLFDLVGMDYGLASFPEKLRKTREIFGLSAGDVPLPAPAVDIPGSFDFSYPIKQDSLEEGEIWIQGDPVCPALRSRGISEETCRKFGFSQWEDRVYFPLRQQGRLMGYCARALSDQTVPRYLNSPGPLPLWNGDYLSEKGNGQFLYVTEGILDATVLEQMGRRAIALCGSQNGAKLVTQCKTHLEQAVSYQFVLCGDEDTAGRRMNRYLSENLSHLGISVTCMNLSVGKDINEAYLREPESVKQALFQVENEKNKYGQERPVDGDLQGSAAAFLDVFFSKEGLPVERPVSTGFVSLDQFLDGGIYPGLAVLGAVSSLGKTSFLLQLADTIAAAGQDVLFFSLEQSALELVAKSLSRISAVLSKADGSPAYTSRQWMNHSLPAAHGRLEQIREIYSGYASRLFFREGCGDLGAGEIRAAVADHLSRRGKRPVVMVDYLQILKPGEVRATDKQNMDRTVVELRRLSRDFGVPVVAASSFNRESYRQAVSMEAFKESGAVEYASDLLLGMQLLGTGDPNFDVNVEKSRQPRRMELVILKNRNGLPYAKIRFDYDARYNLFIEK